MLSFAYKRSCESCIENIVIQKYYVMNVKFKKEAGCNRIIQHFMNLRRRGYLHYVAVWLSANYF